MRPIMRIRHHALLIAAAAVLCSGPPLRAAAMDAVLEHLDLSGYLQIRMWNVPSRTYVPGKFKSRHTYKNVNYFDLFFRNRFTISILPEIEIRSVFDVSAKFGKNDFSIDGGPANLITRDVYAVFRPFKNSELSIGLEPFSLPGGYIIARDATGIHLSHFFEKSKVSISASYVKAYDDADDSFGQGSDVPDFIWDDIVIFGTKFNISSLIQCEAYYVYEDDRYTTNRLTFNTTNFTAGLTGDRKKGSLHWAGLHAMLLSGPWFLRAGGIVNAGVMFVRNEIYAFKKVRVLAGLFEFETGFSAGDLKISAIAEGATGDPDRPYSGRSFQSIKGAHDFSYIVVDSTGGLSLRGSGESCWYGLYGCGVNLSCTFIDAVTLQVKLLHFGTMKTLYWRRKGTTWYGDEADLGVEYRFRNTLNLFLNAGGFLPRRAYSAQMNMSNNRGYFSDIESRYVLRDLDNYSSKSMIFEVMLGVKVSYD